MCAEYERRKGYRRYLEEFSMLKLPLKFPEPHAAPNLEPQDKVKPTDPGVVFRERDGGVEMVQLRWWLIPAWHKGKLKEFKFPTFNARAEGLATTKSFKEPFKKRRCLVAADAWVEWTGKPKQKTKWRIAPKNDEPICFAGLWDRAETSDAGTVESFTIVTQPAGALLDKIHDRAPVVLRQDEWMTWLDLAADVTELLGPASRDLFDVTYVSGPQPSLIG